MPRPTRRAGCESGRVNKDYYLLLSSSTASISADALADFGSSESRLSVIDTGIGDDSVTDCLVFLRTQ